MPDMASCRVVSFNPDKAEILLILFTPGLALTQDTSPG